MGTSTLLRRMSMKKDSVIRPGDIPVKANRYKTVLSPVVSDLAASLLVDPLEMGVKPIPSVPVDFLGLDSKDLPEKSGNGAKKLTSS